MFGRSSGADYGTSVEASRLDGALVLDSVALAHTEVGQPDGAPLELWDSALSVVSFCGPGQKLALAGQHDHRLSALRSRAPAGRAASVQGDGFGRRLRKISSCEEVVSAPGCAPLDPVRMRPPKQ